MILRCTAKLQALVGRLEPGAESLPASGDDWYANLLWIERRKCLLVTHSETRFSVFAPNVRAAELRPIGPFVVPMIVRQLAAEGLPTDTLGTLDPSQVKVARTADRSLLGCMNDLALTCEYAVAGAGGLIQLDLAALHRGLQRHLSGARGYVPAIELIADHTAGGSG